MTFWSALLLGLVSSLHCAAMCGGFSCLALAGGAPRGRSLVAVNAGRLTTYGAAGWQWLPPDWDGLPRLITGTALAAVGLHILFGLRFLTPLERLGRRLFGAVMAGLRPHLGGTGVASRYGLGLAWGLLPCGLVYYVWLMAAASGSAAAGLAISVGFGLGTLPALLAAGALGARIRMWLGPRLGRRAAGVATLLLAGWVVLLPLLPMVSAPSLAASAPAQCH